MKFNLNGNKLQLHFKKLCNFLTKKTIHHEKMVLLKEIMKTFSK